MKWLRALIAGKLRSIADSIESKNNNDNDVFVDLMADVDDQRAHHYAPQKTWMTLHKKFE